MCDGMRRWLHRLREHPVRVCLRVAVSIVLALAYVYYALPLNFGGRTTLVVVQGHSMEPTYHSKDLMYVRTDREIKVGEPAVYRVKSADGKHDVMIIHRIRMRDEDGNYIFRGDNKSTDDTSPVRAEDIVGVPVLNLGPLPTRLLAVLPLLGTLVIGVLITWMLWPTKRVLRVTETIESAQEEPSESKEPLSLSA